jgi:hypothetical protein
MADNNTTEMAAAMVHGNRSNGWRQRQQQWAIATEMVTSTAMGSESEMATAMAKEMATARATMKEGLPLHVVLMCSAFGRATPCLHPHGHKESSSTSAASWGWHCKEYLLPFKGEGSWQLTMDGFLFIIYNYCSVYWTTLCLPPCIIQALKNPPVSQLMLYLLHSSKNPISLLRIYPGSYCTFCQGKPGQGMQWL